MIELLSCLLVLLVGIILAVVAYLVFAVRDIQLARVRRQPMPMGCLVALLVSITLGVIAFLLPDDPLRQGILGLAALLVFLGYPFIRITNWMSRSTSGRRSLVETLGFGELERSKVTPELRQEVLERDDYLCRYCGRRAQTLHIDHVIPIRMAGKSTLSNLVTACSECNRRKGGRTPYQAGMRLRPPPSRRKGS